MTHHLPPYLSSFAHFYPPPFHSHAHHHHQQQAPPPPHSAPPTQCNFPFSTSVTQPVFNLPLQHPFPSAAYPPATYAPYTFRPNFAVQQSARLVPFEPDPDAEGESEVEPDPHAHDQPPPAGELEVEVNQDESQAGDVSESDDEWVGVSNKKKKGPASRASTKANVKSKKSKSKPTTKAKSKKPKVRAPPRGRNTSSLPSLPPGAPAGSFAPLSIPAGSAETEEDSSVLFSLSPSRPPITLRGVRRPVLPPPPGAVLEIAGLLILHPPSLDKDARREPINQYTGTHYSSETAGTSATAAAAAAGGPVGPGGPTEWKSQYEMYTCRLCMKTYDGKNARSVARRHLQDKHGLPLSMQGRRSRWDQEKDRPKDAEEVRERGLRSKRDWAAKHRQQIRLERAHSDFLSLFGPLGLTLDGVRLVAPHLRGTKHVRGRWLDGTTAATTGTIEVPPELLDGVRAMHTGHLTIDLHSPLVGLEGEVSQLSASTTALDPTACGFGEDMAEEVPDLEYAQFEQLSWAYGQYHSSLPTAQSIDESLPSASSTHQVCVPQPPPPGAGSGQWATEAIQHFTAIDRPTRSNASTSTAAPSPISTISVGPSPAPAHPGGQVWVSSTGWTPAPSRWQPPSLSHLPTPAKATPGAQDEPCEAVAAESLLNLHSTPLRPDSNSAKSTRTRLSTVRSSLTRPKLRLGHLSSASTDTGPSTAASAHSSTTLVASTRAQDDGGVSGKDKSLDPQQLLAAAEITSRPRSERSRSFVQPFARSRPESLTRSLSFSMTPTIEADDPFIDHPPLPAGQSRAKTKMDASPDGCDSPSTHLAKRRKTISSATSGLTLTSADNGLGNGNGNVGQRRPLQPLEPNAASASSSAMAPTAMGSLGKDKSGLSFGASAFGLTPLGKTATPKLLGSAMRDSLRDFATPLRQMVKENLHPPSSDPVAKWLVSSPVRESPDKCGGASQGGTGERTAIRLGLGVAQNDMRRVMGTPLEKLGEMSRGVMMSGDTGPRV